MSAFYDLQTNIPSTFSAGIVAGSYFASLCGCLLTIEILHRRGTALRNWRSWIESLACAISMGLVGIWCMHFIGNRSIVLGNGDPSIQLVYAPTWTVLSVFLPVIGLTIAFSAAEFSSLSPILHWVALTCTGVFAGLSVTSMHYLGNIGITNYYLAYRTRFLVASVIIAVGDCWAVLLLFYRLREKWISSWWKRLLCAALLAGGVSAMHFTASTSCEYKLRHYNSAADLRARKIQVLVAGGLCGAAAVLIAVILLVAHRRDRRVQSRSQKVMLACAMFDPDGRVLVTTDGVLPSREITDKYNHRTFNDDFDTSHPVFLWIYRVTHNWASVVDLISKMKSHLSAQKGSIEDDNRPASSQSSAVYDADTYNDYEVLFRERFCVAASAIASSMNLSLDQLGVLYDHIIETGTLRIDSHNRICNHKNLSSLTQSSDPDIEAALHLSLFGKGQLMFITRTLNPEETHKLLNAGFKFAYVEHVGRNIAHAMQIPLTTLLVHLDGLKRYVGTSAGNAEKPGTWLTIFAMIPKPGGKGFDVVVKKDARDQLPETSLLANSPSAAQIALLSSFDGMRATQILTRLSDSSATSETSPVSGPEEREAYALSSNLRRAIPCLFSSLPKEWASEARFYAKPLHAHYVPTKPSSSSPTAGPIEPRPAPATQTTTIFAFTAIPDLHTSHLVPLSSSISATSSAWADPPAPSVIGGLSGGLTRIPRTFFELRHRCYTDNSLPARRQRLKFKRDVHGMFDPIFAKRVEKRPMRASAGSILLIRRMQKKSTGMTDHSRGTIHYTDRERESPGEKQNSVESGSATTRTSGSTIGEDRVEHEQTDGRESLLGQDHVVAAPSASANSSPSAHRSSQPSSGQQNTQQDRTSDSSKNNDKATSPPAATELSAIRTLLKLPRKSVSDIKIRNRALESGDLDTEIMVGSDIEHPSPDVLEDQAEADLTFVDELVAVTKARFGVGTMVRF